MRMNNNHMPSGSYGGFSGPWQKGPGVAEAYQEMKEILKMNSLGEGFPDSLIDNLNATLMSNAYSMEEYRDLRTLHDRLLSIFGGRREPQSSSSDDNLNGGRLSDCCGMEPMTNNGLSQPNNYYGESSQNLQPDGMFDAGTTTTMQNQPPNYSQLEHMQMPFCSDWGSSYSDSQMHNVSGGWIEQFELQLPHDTFQGQHPAPANSASYRYAPTGQPSISMDYGSYGTGMTSYPQETLHQTKKAPPTRDRPRRVSAQATACESGCEYCGKHRRLVEFFLWRTDKPFREKYPKLCEKMDYLSQHLKKCSNQSCGCSMYRPYQQHSDGLLNVVKKGRKVAPDSLNPMRSTRKISDRGDDGQLSCKFMRHENGFRPVYASVDQITPQVGDSQMGRNTSWELDLSDISAYDDNSNLYGAPLSLENHAQELETMKPKTDGASQTESPSSGQTFNSSITQETDQEPVLKDSSSKGN
ncbi:hypothetical protein MKW94_005423 [Papaver nudicaule]|uniref:Uncharacterized protein n=1 Tax=Papaver nudicaule TaxID=74823 RepID=A0AA41UY96_PAPNU|nr:hypothetical protein [Papaver nudicaule]